MERTKKRSLLDTIAKWPPEARMWMSIGAQLAQMGEKIQKPDEAPKPPRRKLKPARAS